MPPEAAAGTPPAATTAAPPPAPPPGGNGAAEPGQQQQQQAREPDPQPQPPARDGGGRFTYADDDWRKPIAEAEPDLAKGLSKFTSPTDLAKSYAQAQRALTTRVMIPEEGDPPEAWARFYKRVGVPDKPEEYGLAPADPADPDAADRLSRLAAKAHELRLPKAAAAELMGFVQEEAAAVEARRVAALEAERVATEAALKREWGRDYDANLRIAAATLAAFSGQAMLPANIAELKLADGRALGNVPEIARVFAAIGRRFGLQEGALPEAGVSTETKEDLKQEANRIMNERNWRDDPGKVRRVEQIYVMLYGDAPLQTGVVPG